jgi:hypothetical protein
MAAITSVEIPSKTEIIPLHQSDVSTFKRCRRKWEWSSPMRMNLTGRSDQLGIVDYWWFGSGIHYALSQYYDPNFQRDPVEAFVWWYSTVMNGGRVTEDQLELGYDRKPKQTQVYGVGEGSMEWDGTYTIRGLYDLLAQPDDYEFEEMKELGINMMKFYREWAPANDDFTVIDCERVFSVPILDPATGEPLIAIDPRDGAVKQVHARGKRDAVIQDNGNGQYGILEHKTAQEIGEGYFDKLDKDEQCTRYMWAGEYEADLYDLPYKHLSFVHYNGIRKAYPRTPTELKSGMFSIDRTKESTTYALLQQFIKERPFVQMAIRDDEKAQAYIEYVREKGDEQFVQRKTVYRNRAEIKSCGERVYMEAMDMLQPDLRIYPNPTGDHACLRCPFRGPCIARDDGSDWQQMLADNYEPNVGR